MNTDERTLLLRSLDADLSADERARVDDLLQTAPEARAVLDEHQSVRRFVAEHGAGAFSAGFADGVMDALPAAPPAANDARADRAPVAPSSHARTHAACRAGTSVRRWWRWRCSWPWAWRSGCSPVR